MRSATNPKPSIVVPAYNESEGIIQFHDELLLPIIKSIADNSYEIIYVNDGSKDDTLEKLKKIASKDKNVKVINLSRNFGKEIATTAGIFESTGDTTIILDSDGQHPPKLIPDFIEQWKKGSQVVVGVRNKEQHEGMIKAFGSKVFYKLFNGTSDTEFVPRSTDFRLISSEVREEFIKFSERNRITRGLIDWLGFKRSYIYFDSPARIAGKASYKTSQLFKLAANSFVSLSLKPLFIFGWVGVAITLFSLCVGLFILIEQLILGDPLKFHFSGPFILGVFTSFLIGTVLVSQAILAAYISHIHTQTQSRPLFVVDKKNSTNL
jgi:glycosyltransferase involved in cell wall biosynthesis